MVWAHTSHRTRERAVVADVKDKDVENCPLLEKTETSVNEQKQKQKAKGRGLRIPNSKEVD